MCYDEKSSHESHRCDGRKIGIFKRLTGVAMIDHDVLTTNGIPAAHRSTPVRLVII